MSNLRLVVHRIITCTVLGAAFLPVTRVLGIVTSGHDAAPSGMPGAAGMGALYGLLAGIAWSIEYKPARQRFILGIAVGYLFGIVFTLAFPTGSRLPVVLFPMAGALIGGVLALASARVYRDKLTTTHFKKIGILVILNPKIVERQTCDRIPVNAKINCGQSYL